MPLAFAPVIGSGFDQVMGQQAGWAGFNRGVDEGNIARANAAQENANNYLARVADIQRQNVAQQAAYYDAAQQRADTLAQNQQQFGLQRAALKAQQEHENAKLQEERARTEAMVHANDAAAAQRDFIQAQQVENRGMAYASNYVARKAELDAAEASLQSAQDRVDDLQAALDEEQAKPAKEQKPGVVAALNQKIRMAEKDRQIAIANHTRAVSKIDALTTAIQNQNQGFELVPDEGIVHTDSGRKWAFAKHAVEAPPLIADPSDPIYGARGISALGDKWATDGQTPATPETDTATALGRAVSSPFRALMAIGTGGASENIMPRLFGRGTNVPQTPVKQPWVRDQSGKFVPDAATTPPSPPASAPAPQFSPVPPASPAMAIPQVAPPQPAQPQGLSALDPNKVAKSVAAMKILAGQDVTQEEMQLFTYPEFQSLWRQAHRSGQ